MRFGSPLIPGRLLRRYKRFFAEVTLADGRLVTAHCPNSGTLLGCQDRPAYEIDPEYSRWLRRAVEAGVRILPYRARVTPREIALRRRLELITPEWSS